jgi:hypothetical protein
MAGKTDIMRVLIDAGADVHGTNLEQPPLFAAAFGRWGDAVRMLLDAGVDPNMRSNNNVGTLYPAIRNRAPEVVKLLVERGARIDDDDGALNVAAVDSTDHAADRELFAQLISLGARVDAHGPDGWTALMSAARKGHEGDARFLLAKGADAALKNAKGQTALALAQAERKDCLVSGHGMPPKLDRVIALLSELGSAAGATG